MAAGKTKQNPYEEFGFTPEQLDKFLALLEAVQRADRGGTAQKTQNASATPTPSAEDVIRDESAFGYEVISALLGRAGPPQGPFAEVLATAAWADGALQIKGAPGRFPEGATVEITTAAGSTETLRLDAAGAVKPSKITAKDTIARILIRDIKNSTMLGFAGPVRATRSTRTRG